MFTVFGTLETQSAAVPAQWKFRGAAAGSVCYLVTGAALMLWVESSSAVLVDWAYVYPLSTVHSTGCSWFLAGQNLSQAQQQQRQVLVSCSEASCSAYTNKAE